MEIKNKITKILKANKAFYDAFAAGDLLAIKKLWADSHEISVIHPGSEALHGQNAVMKSWELIFDNSGRHDIKCVNEKVYVNNESAYVVCSEMFPEVHLLATNIFVLENNDWRMVHHQAGPSASIEPDVSHKNMSGESSSIH